MSKPAELLALRKQLLIARSAMLRLQIVHHAHELRESVRLPRMASSAGSSPGMFSALLGLATLVLGRRKFGRWIGFAAAAFGAVRSATSLWRGIQGGRTRNSGDEPPHS